jgi:hypothetical protein
MEEQDGPLLPPAQPQEEGPHRTTPDTPVALHPALMEPGIADMMLPEVAEYISGLLQNGLDDNAPTPSPFAVRGDDENPRSSDASSERRRRRLLKTSNLTLAVFRSFILALKSSGYGEKEEEDHLSQQPSVEGDCRDSNPRSNKRRKSI